MFSLVVARRRSRLGPVPNGRPNRTGSRGHVAAARREGRRGNEDEAERPTPTMRTEERHEEGVVRGRSCVVCVCVPCVCVRGGIPCVSSVLCWGWVVSSFVGAAGRAAVRAALAPPLAAALRAVLPRPSVARRRRSRSASSRSAERRRRAVRLRRERRARTARERRTPTRHEEHCFRRTEIPRQAYSDPHRTGITGEAHQAKKSTNTVTGRLLDSVKPLGHSYSRGALEEFDSSCARCGQLMQLGFGSRRPEIHLLRPQQPPTAARNRRWRVCDN